MCFATVLRLAVVAAAVTWPLLVFASIQIGGLLVLIKCFGAIRGPHTTEASPPCRVPLAAGVGVGGIDR